MSLSLDKRMVLIDCMSIGSVCGFGEICNNLCPRIASLNLPDLHFVLLVPTEYVNRFGQGVSYVTPQSLQAFMKEHKIDLWHSIHQQYTIRPQNKEILKLLCIHDLNFVYEKGLISRMKHHLIIRNRIKHSDCVTTISNFVKNDLLRYYHFEGKGLRVIYNGIKHDEEGDEVQPSFVENSQEPFFFTIGQIRKKKNFHVLVPMMKHLPEYKLYICGDTHFKYAESLKNDIGQTPNVKLTGIITEAEKRWLYRHCQAFLFPSKLEGFGLPVIEAMNYGCRVVSSTCTCLPEIGGAYASYWENFEPEYMVQVVKEAIANWDRESEAAHEMQTYARSFSYERYIESYINQYREMLFGSKSCAEAEQ